ncbi:uncharacterized protein LOC131152398 [Malania oleifera]|uniref:uncharacterized protein LOC131152398 n=1 Tax=Malania oleifera TaxID=397392 RepID=UPI0025ADF924|nr:uncharacterized protein LOC131152398 [Malania oleifera]XP_057960240.1 uncharacterized protein LOC131152398 [Malania oleifera]
MNLLLPNPKMGRRLPLLQLCFFLTLFPEILPAKAIRNNEDPHRSNIHGAATQVFWPLMINSIQMQQHPHLQASPTPSYTPYVSRTPPLSGAKAPSPTDTTSLATPSPSPPLRSSRVASPSCPSPCPTIGSSKSVCRSSPASMHTPSHALPTSLRCSRSFL